MALIISEATIQATCLTEDQLKQEISILLFASGKLTIGHASALAEMPQWEFQKLLESREIPLYSYDVPDYEQDLENLAKMGDL